MLKTVSYIIKTNKESTSLRLTVQSVNSNSPSSSPGRQEISDTKSPAFVFSVNSGPSTPAFSKLGCDFAAEEVNFRSWKTDRDIFSSTRVSLFHLCVCLYVVGISIYLHKLLFQRQGISGWTWWMFMLNNWMFCMSKSWFSVSGNRSHQDRHPNSQVKYGSWVISII